MKAVAAWMSVWVLFLSLLPCNDADDHTHFPPATSIHASLQSDNHNEHGENSEHCAPFCHCNCCQSTVTIHHAVLTFCIQAPTMQRFPMLHDQYEGRPLPSLWHPPLA